jgi:hypothetical protein
MSEVHNEKKLEGIGKKPWGSIFGLAVVGLYIGFTTIAIIRYPYEVSPLDTYLSMLGNADLSPHGAFFYNLAVILTGVTEIPFFITVYIFHLQYSPKWLLFIGMLAGLCNGLAVFMSGVNPLRLTGNINAHVTWSYIIFFSLIPVLLVFGAAFWKVKGFPRFIGLFGFIACAIDIIFLVTLLSGHIGVRLGSIMEWFSVFSYLVWITLVSIDMLGRSSTAVRM